ncbi:hypothetical protein NL676_033816 [Syzygium grande]|nr:hypothetical protein NL676_033816 [Syzygium grande]
MKASEHDEQLMCGRGISHDVWLVGSSDFEKNSGIFPESMCLLSRFPRANRGAPGVRPRPEIPNRILAGGRGRGSWAGGPPPIMGGSWCRSTSAVDGGRKGFI